MMHTAMYWQRGKPLVTQLPKPTASSYSQIRVHVWDMDRGLWQVVQQGIRGRPPAAPISGKRPKQIYD